LTQGLFAPLQKLALFERLLKIMRTIERAVHPRDKSSAHALESQTGGVHRQ
jgi:hypothetical protein